MTIAPIEVFAQGTTAQLVSLGLRHADQYGRTFHYAKATTAVGRGKVAKTAAVITTHNNLNFASAPAVGAFDATVTLASAVTADQYKDGWLVVQDGGGEGRAYRIEGHAAQATATGDVKIFLAEKIDTLGVIAEANVDLIYNKYDELLPPADTSQAYIPVGVPIGVGGLGVSEFGWVQTWGPCSVWQDDTTTLGDQISWGTGTGTGQVENRNAITEALIGEVGPAVGVADEYQLVYLKIDR